MNKNLLFSLLFFFSFLVVNAQSLDDIWDSLLQNKRNHALNLVSELNDNDDIESIILRKIIKTENGQLKFDINFVKSIISSKNFEYYLFALWNEPYFFNDYFENGFATEHSEIFESIDFSKVENTTLIGAITYLNGIVKRHNRDWDTFNDKIRSINSIKDWEYCGVFENLNMSGIDIVYPPENEPNLEVLFDAQSNGKTQWYKNRYTSELYNIFSNHQEFGNGVHYAQTFIDSEEDQTVFLKLGKSGLVKVWLNDRLIIEKGERYVTEMDAYTYKVKLQKGVNRILVKIASNSDFPYFILRLENLDGSPVNNIKTTFKNRKYRKDTSNDILLEEEKHFAEAYFENRLATNSGSEFLNRLCLFKTYLRNGKLEEAYSVVEDLNKVYPNSSFLKALMISYYNKLGDDASISKLKENLIRRDPNYYISLLYTYEDFDELMKLDMQEYKSKLNQLGNAVDVSYIKTMSEVLIDLRENDFVSLRTGLDNLISNKNLPSSIHATFSEFYSQLFNDDNTTIKTLETFNDKYFNWEVATYLAYYYSKQNRTEDALSVYTQVLKNFDQDNNYHYKIVEILHETMQFERSLPFIEKALENFPESFLFSELKGAAYLQLNKKAEAIELYKESLSKNPSNRALRSKINDLSNWVNPLSAFEIDNFYTYIDENRGIIKSNNYGLNTILSQSNILGYQNGGGEYKSTFIYEITSQNGVNIFKEYDLGLSGDYLIAKAEIIKKNGDIVPADTNGSVLVFDQLEISDVILINYSSSYSTYGRFYKDHILRHNFSGYHPTMFHIYRFISKKKKINFTITGGKVDYSNKKVGDYYVHQWQEKNTEPLPIKEDYMPSFSDIVSRLHISSIDSWNEIANWYSDLVRNQLRKDNVVKNEYKKLFPDGHEHLSEEARARVIYYYIMDNYNYSYVNFRQSGYVPQKPANIIKSKLGDCKDLSSLFLVLAQMADLKSNLVLILTSGYGKNNLVKPSTDFNHCIVKVKLDGDDFYLELTDKNLPFKSLPMSLRNATALDIPFQIPLNSRNDLYYLTAANREKAHFLSEYKMYITDSVANLDLKYNVKGHLASYYIKMQEEKKDDLLKETVFKEISDRSSEAIELNEIKDVKNIRSNGSISYHVGLSLDLEVNQIGDYYTFKVPKFLHPYNESIIELKSRNYPIDYKQYENSDFYDEKIEILLPSGFKFVEIPKPKKYKYKNHAFSIDYKLLDQDKLNVNIVSKVNTEDISQNEYLEFKSYVKSVLDTKETLIKYKRIN
ncbi:tetratricopeptide repeat protein [Winogradskyella sp.]|uniref:tetratricopeptide repeat protein n=1 Tax=Winogradskyella sp. TaxID=1883156 RepID=UPI0026236419|nr:tetratricopeptide repeat protein [Winogradskyella sp.]